MIRLLLLVIGLASYAYSDLYQCKTPEACKHLDGSVECSGDCGCGDVMVSECSRPHPTTAVHVDTIEDCMANCKDLQLENRCKFIIFHYDNIAENCIIMNDKLDDYVAHCNVRAQAMWGRTPKAGLARWSNCISPTECDNDFIGHNCESCTDCNNDPCSGFMLSGCNVHSDVQESVPIASWDNCETWARVRGDGTAVLFNREESTCELYGGIWDYDNFISKGFNRVCDSAIVDVNTDPTKCGV